MLFVNIVLKDFCRLLYRRYIIILCNHILFNLPPKFWHSDCYLCLCSQYWIEVNHKLTLVWNSLGPELSLICPKWDPIYQPVIEGWPHYEWICEIHLCKGLSSSVLEVTSLDQRPRNGNADSKDGQFAATMYEPAPFSIGPQIWVTSQIWNVGEVVKVPKTDLLILTPPSASHSQSLLPSPGPFSFSVFSNPLLRPFFPVDGKWRVWKWQN